MVYYRHIGGDPPKAILACHAHPCIFAEKKSEGTIAGLMHKVDVVVSTEMAIIKMCKHAVTHHGLKKLSCNDAQRKRKMGGHQIANRNNNNNDIQLLSLFAVDFASKTNIPKLTWSYMRPFVLGYYKSSIEFANDLYRVVPSRTEPCVWAHLYFFLFFCFQFTLDNDAIRAAIKKWF